MNRILQNAEYPPEIAEQIARYNEQIDAVRAERNAIKADTEMLISRGLAAARPAAELMQEQDRIRARIMQVTIDVLPLLEMATQIDDLLKSWNQKQLHHFNEQVAKATAKAHKVADKMGHPPAPNASRHYLVASDPARRNAEERANQHRSAMNTSIIDADLLAEVDAARQQVTNRLKIAA
jgi:hypothetical protein